MHRLYRKSRIHVVNWRWFYIRYVKNDATLCKLDVYVKNRMAVADSVDFLKLETEKVLLYSKFFLDNQMW